ncbi:MAG: DUF3579 domain-containing protein [Pseudomonadota bacterium]|nr:DUF3579 domain-containing protein [Pseudomonadota bacterium]
MPDKAIGEVVIRGITTLGRPFRPSDWADRLASIVGHVGRDNRLHYSPDVQPVTRAGVRCVVIDRGLAERDTRIFKFLLDFARENDLEVVDGRKEQR